MLQDHLEGHIGQARGATFHSCHRKPLFVNPALLGWTGQDGQWSELAGLAWSHTSLCSWAAGAVTRKGKCRSRCPFAHNLPSMPEDFTSAPLPPLTLCQHAVHSKVPALQAPGVCGPELFTRFPWSPSASSNSLHPLWPVGYRGGKTAHSSSKWLLCQTLY